MEFDFDGDIRHTMNIEEFEEGIFRAATKRGGAFRTYHRQGHVRREFNTFPEALADIRGKQEVLVYAVTPSGRTTCLPNRRWNEFAQIWIDVRGKKVESRFKDPKGKEPAHIYHVLTKNADGRYSVYGASMVNEVRCIMSGDFLTFEDARALFPELKKEEYRR